MGSENGDNLLVQTVFLLSKGYHNLNINLQYNLQFQIKLLYCMKQFQIIIWFEKNMKSRGLKASKNRMYFQPKQNKVK